MFESRKFAEQSTSRLIHENKSLMYLLQEPVKYRCTLLNESVTEEDIVIDVHKNI